MGLLGAFVVSLAALASASPHGKLKRQVSQLRSNYDFVIVGGGTSGLTTADRLSQAFPKSDDSDPQLIVWLVFAHTGTPLLT